MTANTDLEILRRMMALTEEGELPGGLVVAGVVYRKFKMALSTSRDHIDVERLELKTEVEQRAASFAKSLTFDGLPKNALTHEALLSLPLPDWNAIAAAAVRLHNRYANFRGGDGKAEADHGGDRRTSSASPADHGAAGAGVDVGRAG